MNKIELVETIAKQAEISKVVAERALNSFISIVIAEIQQGHKVAIAGLGNFEKVDRPARLGVNPATGVKIEIAAKSVPKFKAAKSFKDAVAKKQ